MQWRELTPDEMAHLPEARLGGSLLWIFVAAAAIATIPALGFALTLAALAAGSIHSGPIELPTGFSSGIVDLGARYIIAVALLVGGSLMFIVMTLLRLRATPLVASVGLALWVSWRFTMGYVGQAVLEAQAGKGGLFERLIYHWPFAIDMLGELAMLVAFCGYMAAGRRPNVYYRRRLAV